MGTASETLGNILGIDPTSFVEPVQTHAALIFRLFRVEVQQSAPGLIFVGPASTLSARNFRWFIKSLVAPIKCFECKRVAFLREGDVQKLDDVSRIAGIHIRYEPESSVLSILACEDAGKDFLSKKSLYFSFGLEYFSVSKGTWTTPLATYTRELERYIFETDLIHVSSPNGGLIFINMERMVITDSETFSRVFRIVVGVVNPLPAIETIHPPHSSAPSGSTPPIEPPTEPQVEPFLGDGAVTLFTQFPNLRGRKLRSVMMDGCNVGYAHGRNQRMSVKGIKVICDFFKAAGVRAQATIPEWRLLPNRTDKRGQPAIYDPENLARGLVEEGILIPLPAGYEDHYVVDLARKSKSVIITIDQYRDLKKPELRDYIRFYSFNFAIRGDVFFVNRRNGACSFEEAITMK